MRLPSIGVVIFFAVVVTEVVAYSVAIQQFGWLASILFGLLSLASGILILRRLGLRIGQIFSDNFNDGRIVWARIRGVGWTALAAILLILPGFLTNLAGFGIALLHMQVLLSPSGPGEPDGEQILDLQPTEWNESEPKQADQRHIFHVGPHERPDRE